MDKIIVREPEETSASFAARRAAKKMTNRALVARVKAGFKKIRSELPYIKELRDRFKAAPRGAANIDGCQTWTEFCERRLHRTDRRIQQVLAEETEISVRVEKLPEKEETLGTVTTVEVHDEHHTVDLIRYVHTDDEGHERPTGYLHADGHISVNDTTHGAKHYDRRNDEYRDEYTDADAATDTAEKEPEADTATPKKKLRKIENLVIRPFASSSALEADMDLFEACIIGLFPDDLIDNGVLMYKVVLTLRRVAFELEGLIRENRLGA